MAISEAHRRANQKWDRKNMLTVGVRLKRTEAEKFKKFAASQGLTANAVLKRYVYECLSQMEKSGADVSARTANVNTTFTNSVTSGVTNSVTNNVTSSVSSMSEKL